MFRFGAGKGLGRVARTTIRLFFDELLPHRVAKALRVLGFNVGHVGSGENGAPERSSGDDVVLAHAKSTNQVIVTYNHDMILLCAEEGESVIWIDPRGRQFRRTELVVLAFTGIERWEELLRLTREPACVHVLRTKIEVMRLERAAHLSRQRIKRLQARERKRTRVSRPDPTPRLI